MMDAFSNAREYCDVGFCVNASYLISMSPRSAKNPAPIVYSSGDSPGEGDLDVIFVHGKPQIQQLQLPIVSIQQIATRRAVRARASHILP